MQYGVPYHTVYGTQEISIAGTYITCENLTKQLQTVSILVILLSNSFMVLQVQQYLAENQ